jgi:hypothetical protein
MVSTLIPLSLRPRRGAGNPMRGVGSELGGEGL